MTTNETGWTGPPGRPLCRPLEPRDIAAECNIVVADPGGNPMLDVIYILIGAAFLGGCVLYTIACDGL
jgi:hypothetical protein